MTRTRIAVIGAGLVGSVVALELAARGAAVTLIERANRPMTGASLHNEGKVHLGFVYALDPTGNTREGMIEGAMHFAPILDRICGPLPWEAIRTEGFRYAVMPDSLADPGTLEAAYADVDSRSRALLDDRPDLSYLGLSPHSFWASSDDDRGRPVVDGRPVETLYRTAELAIDPRTVALAVVDALDAHPSIDVLAGHRVIEAQRSPSGGFGLTTIVGDIPAVTHADAVVNCAWADRTRLDGTVGMTPERQRWSYRTKYSIVVRPHSPDHGLVPVTMVQGPYGDLVPRADGTVYISWYPVARTYFGTAPPPDFDSDEARRVAVGSLDVLGRMFPGLAGASVISSKPGVIIAEASTDVDDPTSGLHIREELGVTGADGWWSIQPAKLTTAPLTGVRAASHVVAALGLETTAVA